MSNSLKYILKPVASLRLTVVLLAYSMLLIFAGTLAQRESGIWQVQHEMFHSWVAWFHVRDLIFVNAPGKFPFIGGYTLIALLLLNLLSAHFVRFKMKWNRSGVILTHVGLIMLLSGEVVTSLAAREGQMTLANGDVANYVNDIRSYELAVIDPAPSGHDDVTVVPASMIDKKGKSVGDARVPFQISIDDYYPNSEVLGPMQPGQPDPRVTAGSERSRKIVSTPPSAGVGPGAERPDSPAAIVTFKKDGTSLGTYLLSLWAHGPQDVKLPNGKVYQVELRFKRDYKPYTVQLQKFSHDSYVGSTLDKNFASHIRLADPSAGVDRTAVIWMNHPLRYGGDTFYQQSFGPDGRGSEFTTLQIVRNPGWLIPYLALGISIVGLLVQFGGHLITFLQRELSGQPVRAPQAAAKTPTAGRNGAKSRVAFETIPPDRTIWDVLLPAGATIIGALCVLVAALPARESASPSYNYYGFGQLPVSYEGRPMPLDTLARTALKIMHGTEYVSAGNKKIAPVPWLLDLMSHKADPAAPKIEDESVRPHYLADTYQTFRIDNPDVLNAIDLDTNRKYFSFVELVGDKKRVAKLQPQLDAAMTSEREGKGETADLTTRKFYELGTHLMLYIRIQELANLFLVPPENAGQDWRSLADVLKVMNEGGATPETLKPFFDTLEAYRQDNVDEFNNAVSTYHARMEKTLPAQSRVDFEAFFNHFDAFSICITFYVTIFLLAAFSWLVWQRPLVRSALWLMVLAFAVHSFGLIARMYISGRPPVTNLYSSAIFIAWGAVVLSIFLELIYRNGIGAVVGSIIGFSSLLIAQSLAVDGDTMAQLRAVLDTNFWLATHVVVITLGYASTFLAGKIALAYIVLGLFTPLLRDSEVRKTLSRMVYGIVCFALLFSFVGTILGGIWADQSWGRFWGWDPKENGAILIVLWNAIILHARWGGLVRERGMAVLAVFGNIVTSWSWFGTNMLGVGLHSYGFMDKAFPVLLAYDFSQLAAVIIGAMVPLSAWSSFQARSTPPSGGTGNSGNAKGGRVLSAV